MTAGPLSLVDAVVIGRNEGERLRRCIESIQGRVATVVYVDSGSTDGSVALARSMGVHVVELDDSSPFTAARARNAGIAKLEEIDPQLDCVQVVDGDCEIVEGWLNVAAQEMETHPEAAVVCGRRREVNREASVYNRLCDMEWDTPVGEARACGGDALIRLKAFKQVGGFDDALIAGEEPELCLRLCRAGWRVYRINHDMTRHDAHMTDFTQWWRRMVRSGHAVAEGWAMHGRSEVRYRVHEVRSIVEWAFLLPVVALALAWWTWGASLILFGGYGILWYRVHTHRVDHGDNSDDASIYALYCILGKFPQLLGIARYACNRLFGRRSRLIEYKRGEKNPSVQSSLSKVQET